MFSTLKNRLTYANVASTTALVLVIGGGGAAVAASMVPANSVGSRQLINNSVKTADLKDGGVTGIDLKDSGVTGVDVADGGLSGADVADGSLTGTDVANGAVDRPGLFGSGDLGVVRAYAWNNSPSANANLTNNGYTYNRSGGAVTVVHNSAGNYTVTFAGLNLNGGNVVVSGYGGSPTWCKVSSWGSTTVNVRCFDAAGAPADDFWTLAATD